MVNIIKQEVVIEESLKKKLELICEFSNTTLKIINGSIRKIEKATKHINDEMDEAAEDFYTDKEDKEKDDGLFF